MKKINVSVYPMDNGQHMTSYIEPFTRKRIRNRFNTLKDAMNYKSDVEFKLQPKQSERFKSVTVSELMKLHIEECPDTRVAEGKSRFLAFCDAFGSYKIKELSKEALQDWLFGLKKSRGYSKSTLSIVKGQLNHFFKYLLDKEIIDDNPLAQIHLKQAFPSSKR